MTKPQAMNDHQLNTTKFPGDYGLKSAAQNAGTIHTSLSATLGDSHDRNAVAPKPTVNFLHSMNSLIQPVSISPTPSLGLAINDQALTKPLVSSTITQPEAPAKKGAGKIIGATKLVPPASDRDKPDARDGQPPQPPNLATDPIGVWDNHVLITRNAFIYKSLSSFACNIAVGCLHGCRFCYVPSVSTIKQGGRLAEHGVDDADADWGQYLLLRPWDEVCFLRSLATAERVPVANLNRDGNRAVMFCSTTDAYQVITHSNPARARELNDQRARIVRRALELIRDRSTLNVRILTRGPLAKLDFELFRSFGNRLMFGMSIPSLDNNLVRLFEPNAPAPARRLEVLREAAKAGIPTFVAIAPAYPDCGAHDLRRTLAVVKEAGVQTVFFESINMRAENVERIRQHAAKLGQPVNLGAFAGQASWRKYSLEQLAEVQRIATELGMLDRLHLWPDKGLLTEKHYVALIKEEFSRLNPDLRLTPEQSKRLNQLAKAKFVEVKGWIERWHQRISEWPGTNNPGDWTAPAIPAGICTPPAPVDLVVQQPQPQP